MKKIVMFVSFLLVLTLFCGCALWFDYDNYAVGNLGIGYSESLEDAFVGVYYYDGTDEGRTIIIPEEYKDVPVNTLGGYYGRGVPTPFSINFTDEFSESLDPNAAFFYSDSIEYFNFDGTEEIEYITFNVKLSKYIKEIQKIGLNHYLVANTADGKFLNNKVYIPLFNFTCDEKNKTFYSKGGKLYYKEGNVLVSDINYHDFKVELHESSEPDSTDLIPDNDDDGVVKMLATVN